MHDCSFFVGICALKVELKRIHKRGFCTQYPNMVSNYYVVHDALIFLLRPLCSVRSPISLVQVSYFKR